MSSGEQKAVAGIDVSARELVVAVRNRGSGASIRRFGNAATGHRALVQWLRARAITSVVMEASGIYSLDVALALHEAEGIGVMVANPRAVHAFAAAMKTRLKTDPVDAEVMVQFGERMPFEIWQPPSATVLELRTLTRRMQSLTRARTREKNQYHAAKKTVTTPVAVLEDLEDAIRSYDRRIERLQREALALVTSNVELAEQHRLLCTIPGVADRSALQLLAELGVLPPDMSAKQWVAHAGLDPRQVQSGTSLQRQPRISRRGNARLRAALYMPALTASRHDPAARRHHEALVAAGKTPMQANVAVMRKLLHGVHGILHRRVAYDGARLFSRGAPTPPPNTAGQAMHAA